REVQRRITPELGNQVQVMLPRHMQSVVVAKVPIERRGGQREPPGDQVQQGVEPASNTASLRREGPVGLRRVLAALWTPRSTLVARGLGLLGCCFGLAGGLLRIAASHLLDADRKRA